jgi:3-hydroxyacyl-CoA dehydrogenase/enoyl-CoA hydratase/3-hydroxybutyryl-CoA epimerase
VWVVDKGLHSGWNGCETMNTYFTSEILDDGVQVLTFDTPASAANVFNRETLSELSTVIDAITANPDVRGLIFFSAKPAIFIAGADLREMARKMSEEDLREMIDFGQQIFNRIAGLPIPTVAAIHGACLGGGYELCLTCDYRIASDAPCTRIGLPETLLGLLPAWGGSTRLPRLIGLPNALDIILQGRRLAAVPAMGRGMIDAVVPPEHLIRAAVERMAKGMPSRPRHVLVNNPLAARVIASRARAQVWKTSRGHYPAVLKALEVAVSGLSKPLADALALESNAIIGLTKTSACRNLMEAFFLQERAKRLHVLTGATAKELQKFNTIAVIGAGIMGAGIAQWVSARGHMVILRDINEEKIRNGLAIIAGLYQQGLKRHTFDRVSARQGMDRIYPNAREVPLTRVDLVFQQLAELTRDDAVLATNTSALSVSEIAAVVKHPERVIGLHFFNPVHKMQLVEVVVGDQTNSVVTEQVLQFVQGIGKLPVVVKDSPGFLVNRVLMPYLMEAVTLFEMGASVVQIDQAMLDFGMPMGPLRLLDEVGIDVAFHVATHVGDAFSDRMHVPEALRLILNANHLGRKTGSGFYVHRNHGVPEVNGEIGHMVTTKQAERMERQDLQERMALALVNEAARCLEEGIVLEPQDVDFAMIMGTGFAPFRGGPLRYADSLEIPQLVISLARLTEEVHPRFVACDLLQDMAKAGKRFYTDNTA